MDSHHDKSAKFMSYHKLINKQSFDRPFLRENKTIGSFSQMIGIIRRPDDIPAYDETGDHLHESMML